MPRAIWKGSISFGLVTIPVGLHTATRREELKFRMLRKGDLSPINYKRVAEVDGKEVPWDDIVKGYEYEKGKFVVLSEEDFKRVDLEAAESIDIMDFVSVDDINPIFFNKPYYLEPQRGGAGAYGLLRDVLAKTNKTGIAKVVIRNRQHLAAVKANGKMLVLEIMHFATDLVPADEFKVPEEKKLGKREEEMAMTLVEQMTEKWDPTRYTDEYKSALMKIIDRKIESGGKELPTEKTSHRKATNVIDLVEVLRKSLEETGKGGTKSGGGKAAAKEKPAAKRRGHHKKAA
jgi:DNA end-binding protein Ku